MNPKKLHIISFDNPFPPVYGGVIDVFYKIEALHKLGFEIYLHCFTDGKTKVSPELSSITKKVWLYRKNRNPLFLFSKIPFAVKSRFHPDLIKNIESVDAPILFEGLQTTQLLQEMNLGERKLFLRLHNIESEYYFGTAKSENNWFRKQLYFWEARKFSRYQENIGRFDRVFTLSKYENDWVEKMSGNAVYVPVFHGNKSVGNFSEFGYFALYHGDLRLADNKKAAKFLIDVFRELDYNLIIASSNGEFFINKHLKGVKNVEFSKIKSQFELDNLLQKAHVNVMLSFQQSGTKLKLINALFKSRHCIINKNMVDDPAILNLCELAETKANFIRKIKVLEKTAYKPEERAEVLKTVLDDQENAAKTAEFL